MFACDEVLPGLPLAMKPSWSAISQALTVALLLAVAGAVWSTYQQAQRIPGLEASVGRLQGKLDAQAERLADLKTAIAVLDARSQREGRAQGRSYQGIE